MTEGSCKKTGFMLKRCIFVLLFIPAVSVPAAAETGSRPRVGAGVLLGSPISATLKVLIKDPHMAQCGIGVTRGDDLYIFGDYLYKIYTIPPVRELSLYLGGGLAYNYYTGESKHEGENEGRLELRIPLGMEFIVPTVPVGISLELAPAIQMIPDGDLHLRGGLGVKYYF